MGTGQVKGQLMCSVPVYPDENTHGGAAFRIFASGFVEKRRKKRPVIDPRTRRTANKGRRAKGRNTKNRTWARV
jgi:hypothetical protein